MFQKEGVDAPDGANQEPRQQAAPRQSGQSTVVAAGSKIRGRISGGTDVLIHGEVEGQLSLGSSVVVAESGVVNGKIKAKRVRVGGKVLGDIRASERIEVLESGSIEGDVAAPRVAIHAGAFFKGKVEMAAEAPVAKAPPAQAPSKAATKPK